MNPFSGEEPDAIIELENLLSTSVRGQMLADVPLGAFLSGGIDSSLIVSLMQLQSSSSVKTFTIGFNEEGYNEAVHAKAVAKHREQSIRSSMFRQVRRWRSYISYQAFLMSHFPILLKFRLSWFRK